VRLGETSTSWISRRCVRIAHRQPARAYKAMIRSLNPVQPGLALARDPRLEAAVPVARHLQVEAADVAQQRLAGHAVTAVARSAPGRVVLYVDRVGTATDIPPLCASFMADAVTRGAPAYCSLLVSLMLTHAPSSPRCGCTMRTRSMRRAIHGGKEVPIHYTHS
jgi:hypothetical protein